MKITGLPILMLTLIAPAFASAQAARPAIDRPQSTTAVRSEDFKLDSRLMARPMPYRVMLPPNYDTENRRRFPVIYLLHGFNGHFGDWSDYTQLAQYLNACDFIVVMPEGGNGWYTDSTSRPRDKYQSYIIRELIPAVDAKFRTLADRNHRIIAGLSMGGYGALKFGLEYPQLFVLVGSFSGALGAPDWTPAMLQSLGFEGEISKTLRDVYGPSDSDTRHANDIFRITGKLTPESIKSLPFIYQSCGTSDPLLEDNHHFLELLDEKKIPHEYVESPGIHDWVFWNGQVREFLELSNEVVNGVPPEKPAGNERTKTK